MSASAWAMASVWYAIRLLRASSCLVLLGAAAVVGLRFGLAFGLFGFGLLAFFAGALGFFGCGFFGAVLVFGFLGGDAII